MAEPIFEALRELLEALHEQFPCADNSKLSPRVIKAANEAGLFLLVQPPDDERAEPPAQPADWQQICGELLQGLDENRHPEVRYPGHLRLVMAAASFSVSSVVVLDEVREAFAELERRQENLHRFRDLRTALAAEPAAPGPATVLPPRPPLAAPPEHPVLLRYGVTWEGSPNTPLLTPVANGYWTPWHVAADLLHKRQPAPAPTPAADGEREELAQWLEKQADYYDDLYPPAENLKLYRAADLLRQRAKRANELSTTMARLASMSVKGWQPISTAPTDGTEILTSDYDSIEIASWDEREALWANRDGDILLPAWWHPLPVQPEPPQGGEVAE